MLCQLNADQMAAKGARKWGVCGHTFHNILCTFGHFSCEIRTRFCGTNNYHGGPARSRKDRSERGRHHAKGTRYVVNSLAALLGASAAIWSVTSCLRCAVRCIVWHSLLHFAMSVGLCASLIHTGAAACFLLTAGPGGRRRSPPARRLHAG